jgi:hypothetical protein
MAVRFGRSNLFGSDGKLRGKVHINRHRSPNKSNLDPGEQGGERQRY